MSHIESCTFQLHNWRPFHHFPTTTTSAGKLQDSGNSSKSTADLSHGPHSKRPCWSDRTTSSFPLDAVLDMSRLSLFDDDRRMTSSASKNQWLYRKRRRRRGSRSVSGRSSDRSGTRRRGCSVGASAASDFPMAAGGTDSSGELFVSGEANWAAAMEAAVVVGRVEKENVGVGHGQFGNFDLQGSESGYGSEPGYGGDAEIGYSDEVEEEEDDTRALFWGGEFRDDHSKLEQVGENSLQKAHHRSRRKKHE